MFGTVSDTATDTPEHPSPSLDAAVVRHLRRRFVGALRQSVHVFQRSVTHSAAGHASHLLTKLPFDHIVIVLVSFCPLATAIVPVARLL